MTREEEIQNAIEWIEGLRDRLNDKDNVKYCNMAIKALEQTEPEKCGDCISRQAAIDLFAEKCDVVRPYHEVWQAVKELPSVKPERKPGKWEYVQYDGNPKIGNWHCSECRRIVFLLHSQKYNEKPLYDFCPWCGVKMEVDNGQS